ncbi:unnamed protein product, partial [Ectocarpus sp. 12 AP-2014]
MFVAMSNSGSSNSCGPISLLQRSMVRDGVPIPAIIEATNGELAGDVRDALQCIRDATVSNSHGRDIFDEHSSDINDEPLSFDDLVHDASALILTKPMWDAIMRCSHGYFDGRAVMGGGEALDLDGLVIVQLNSDGLLEPVDGSSTPIAEAKHLIFHDGHAHFEALVSLEEVLPVTEDVDVAVEEWEPRTSTLGVEEECVAVPLDDAIDYAAGGAGETSSSLLSALLFACAILAFLRIFVVFSRYIGDVVRACMVRVEVTTDGGEWRVGSLFSSCIGDVVRTCTVGVEATAEGGEWGVDSPSSVMGTTDSYTNFTIRVPDESLRCRLVRSRRYRAGTPGGVSRQIFRRHLAALHQVLAEINPPPEPPVCRWTNKSVVFGAVYLAAAIASALAYGFATAFAVFVAMSIWAAVASLLFPVDHARAQAVGVDKSPITRLEAD